MPREQISSLRAPPQRQHAILPPARAKDESEISECEECGKFEEGLGGFGLIRAGDAQGHEQGGEYSEDRAKRF
jgi:hypothetical protein